MVGGPYDAIVDAASRKYGVPPEYIRSVMQVESSGRPDAVSRAGAGGLMQLMPATYAEVAKREGLGGDRFDPTNNIFAGTAYLRQNNDRFGGDWSKTFAAYNAGPSRVERGGPLPAETRAYVPKVRAGIQGQGADVAGYPRTTAGMTEDQMMQLSRNGMMPAPGSGGLLQTDDAKNWFEGLGGVWNAGNTPSQRPAIDPAAAPGSTQTERLNVGGRMNDLVAQLLQQSPQPRGSVVSPLQYQLAGAGQAVGQLAGVRDRKVGIGELLGALGGGLTRGSLAGEQAQRADRADQFAELGAMGKIQAYQRDEAARAQQAQGVAALTRQLRAAGREREAMMLEANPALLSEYAKEQFKAPEQYTLTPGARRVNAAGETIAENPPLPQQQQRPQTVTTREGVFILNPDGTTGNRIGSAVSATPNQSVFEKEAILESDKLAESATGTVSTLRKALDLNDQSFSGATAGARAWLDRNLIPGEHGGTATTEMTNLIEMSALSSLKSLFGGNPTEGERKILMDLNASANKSPEERKIILNNAIAAAEARAARERGRAEQLRGGTYFGQAGGTGGGSDQATSGGDSAPPARAVNPQTGETLEWNGSAWVPAQ
jgi:hypothetical protein